MPQPSAVVFDAPPGSPVVSPEDVPTSVTIDAYDRELAALARLEAIQRDDAALHDVCVALKVQGYTVKELASLFAMDEGRVRRILRQARAAGTISEVVADLQQAALPLAVEKLIEKLDAGEWAAIKETLRGLGAFKTHSATPTPAGPQTSLEVTFVMPPSPVAINPQAIVGRPREARRATIQPCCLEGAVAGPVRESEPGRPLAGGGEGEDEGGGLAASAGTRRPEAAR